MMTDKERAISQVIHSIVRGCFSKQAYRHDKIAQVTAEKISEKRGITLYSYHCNRCGFWHITKNPQNKEK